MRAAQGLRRGHKKGKILETPEKKRAARQTKKGVSKVETRRTNSDWPDVKEITVLRSPRMGIVIGHGAGGWSVRGIESHFKKEQLKKKKWGKGGI